MNDTKELARTDSNAIENALIRGDLSALKPEERLSYYNQTCQSLGLNPLTQPFAYITLNGKLTLYAKRDATEQLRKINGVSITKLEKEFRDDLYIVTAYACDNTGRTDVSTGAVQIAGLKGEASANAIMKAETKAKRRVTLSICGLGLLDETEVTSIPGATPEGDRPAEYKWDTSEERQVVVQKRLAEIKGNGKETTKVVDESGTLKLINACRTPADFNAILPMVKAASDVTKIAMMAAATKLGVAFDKEGKRFVATSASKPPRANGVASEPPKEPIVLPRSSQEQHGPNPEQGENLDADPLAPTESPARPTLAQPAERNLATSTVADTAGLGREHSRNSPLDDMRMPSPIGKGQEISIHTARREAHIPDPEYYRILGRHGAEHAKQLTKADFAGALQEIQEFGKYL